MFSWQRFAILVMFLEGKQNKTFREGLIIIWDSEKCCVHRRWIQSYVRFHENCVYTRESSTQNKIHWSTISEIKYLKKLVLYILLMDKHEKQISKESVSCWPIPKATDREGYICVLLWYPGPGVAILTPSILID